VNGRRAARPPERTPVNRDAFEDGDLDGISLLVSTALKWPLKVTRCSLHGMAEVARYPSAAGAWRAGQPGQVGDGGAVTVRVDADDA
jgi:hypothetical protein